MTHAFQGFRGNGGMDNRVWQVIDTRFPFQCDKCRRVFEKGGKRWIASSTVRLSHYAAGCLCDDCKQGNDPLRKPAPKLAERRTTLD